MNKTQAHAVLAARKAINKALDVYLKRISAQEREWAEAYWVGRVRRDVNGSGYASAPVLQAEELLGIAS